MRSLDAIEQARALLREVDIDALVERDPSASIIVEHFPAEDELLELHAAEHWLCYRAIAGLPSLVVPPHVTRLAPPRAALVVAVVMERACATSAFDIADAFPRPGADTVDGIAEAIEAAVASGLVVHDQDGALWCAGRKAA